MRYVTRQLQNVLLASSVILCLVTTIAYVARPDELSGITFWPVWCWAILGSWLALMGLNRGKRRLFLIVIVLWAIHITILAPELRSLLTFRRWPSAEWEASRKSGRAIRVVSINCGVGNKAALKEAADYRPDIILVQESPSREATLEQTRRLFGKDGYTVVGRDTSILARWPLVPRCRSPKSQLRFYAQARLRLPSGLEVEAFSVHLTPPIFRTDPWRADYWRDYAGKRREQRAQMRELAERLSKAPASRPVIFGGDMNAPAGDAIFRLLHPRLRDTFNEAGVGWGNTVVNDAPVSRFDQVWTTRHFAIAAVIARKVRNSDHRMVICDLCLPDNDPTPALP